MSQFDYMDESMGQDALADEMQICCFTIAGEQYAIDIMKIREIIRPLKITPLPKAPDFIEGIVNLRGTVIPVIEMRKRFGLDVERDFEPRMIIVKVEDTAIGVTVDHVSDVIRIPVSDIQPPPKMIKGIESEYVEGVVKYSGDLIILLNIDRILSTEEKITLKEL